MILADKLIKLRKQNGLSQEEFAEKLGITRQSVSRWEGAQTYPDLQKIVQISEMFGVSADYLLKDEMRADETSGKDVYLSAQSDKKGDKELAEPPEDADKRTISFEQAVNYIRYRKSLAVRYSSASVIFVLSLLPGIVLLLLEMYLKTIGVAAVIGGGMACFVAMVAAGSALLCVYPSKNKKMHCLCDIPFRLEKRLKESVTVWKQTYKQICKVFTTIAVLVFAVIAVSLIYFFMTANWIVITALMFFALCCCTCLLVYTWTVYGSYDKLLSGGEHDEDGFVKTAVMVSTAYWIVILEVASVYVFRLASSLEYRYCGVGILAAALAAYIASMIVISRYRRKNRVNKTY